MSDLPSLMRDYRAAFLRYLPRREEAPLTIGYELGRAAVASGVSLLDMARLHHDILVEVLTDTHPEEIAEVATAASEFFMEVLSTYDMAQRGFLDRAGG